MLPKCTVEMLKEYALSLQFSFPSHVFAAHDVPRDFIYLWIFFEEKHPEDVF